MGWTSLAIKGEKLFGRGRRLALDAGRTIVEFLAQQQADLRVADDEAIKGAIGILGAVEAQQPGRAPRLQHRLQPLRDRERPVFEDDCAQATLFGPGMGDCEAVEGDGDLADDGCEQIAGELLDTGPERLGPEMAAIDLWHANLCGLPLNRGVEQSIAVAKPLIERFLGAAGAPR